MHSGDLPGGWKQVSAVDFSTIPDFPMGTLTSSDSANSRLTSTDAASLALRDKLRFYQAGHPDTAVDGVSAGVYDPGRFSVVAGVLTLNMAVVDGVPTGGHFHPVIAGQESTSGHWRLDTPGVRAVIVLRSNATDPHWGGVFEAISNNNPEDDWPEGGGQAGLIKGNIHNVPSGFDPIGAVAGQSLHDWHRFEIIRYPSTVAAPSVTYLLDGGQIFRSTNAAKIGADTMSVHYQAATDGTAPADGTTSTVEIAYVEVYQYVAAQHRIQQLRGSAAPRTGPQHRIQQLRGSVSATVGAGVRHRIARLRGAVSAPVVANPVTAVLTAPATAEPFQVVTLDASGSTGATRWIFTQTAGPAMTLTGTGATRTFTAPASADGLTLTFRVTVSNTTSGDKTADATVAVWAVSEYLVASNRALVPLEQYIV